MREIRLDPQHLEYRAAAAGTLARSSGSAACAAFGLDDVFDAAQGPGDLAPVVAFLEAQGYAGAITPALGRLALLGQGEPQWAFAAPYGRRGHSAVAGLESGATIVLDRPGTGLVEVSAEPVAPGGAPAEAYLALLPPEVTGERLLVPESERAELAEAALARLRLGIAAELLGVGRRLLDEAVEHVQARRQFGSRLGDFQAVQHLLAWAATELHQLRSLLDVTVASSGPVPDPVLAAALKAVAGRSSHAVTQAAIQVTGAISFTWEYGLHVRQQRVLGLDQLAGPASDLALALGTAVRQQGALPDLVPLSALVR